MTARLKPDQVKDLPGWEIISQGLADIAAGRQTPEACGAWIASPRLRLAGLLGDTIAFASALDAEIVLYRLLGETRAEPYPEYNAFLRRIVRFEHALDRILHRKSVNGARG